MTPAPPENAHIPKTKVLVVADERPLADMFALLLNTNGFVAQPVYSGFAAINTAKKFRPDVAICDIEMRGIDGLRTATVIKKLQPGCGILLISGMGTIGNEAAVLAERLRPYPFELLVKPVHPRDLMARIRVLSCRRGRDRDSSHRGEKRLAPAVNPAPALSAINVLRSGIGSGTAQSL